MKVNTTLLKNFQNFWTGVFNKGYLLTACEVYTVSMYKCIMRSVYRVHVRV
jgi:hypothetical protein